MTVRTFNDEQQAYLETLPAVMRVSGARITYRDEFKIECMRRYLEGDPPSRIFRDAGLDPNMLGAKRVERSIARWRDDEIIMREARAKVVEGQSSVHSYRSGSGKSAFNGETGSRSWDAVSRIIDQTDESDPLEGLLIAQTLYIHQLERTVTQLREQVAAYTTTADAKSA